MSYEPPASLSSHDATNDDVELDYQELPDFYDPPEPKSLEKHENNLIYALSPCYYVCSTLEWLFEVIFCCLSD